MEKREKEGGGGDGRTDDVFLQEKCISAAQKEKRAYIYRVMQYCAKIAILCDARRRVAGVVAIQSFLKVSKDSLSYPHPSSDRHHGLDSRRNV